MQIDTVVGGQVTPAPRPRSSTTPRPSRTSSATTEPTHELSTQRRTLFHRGVHREEAARLSFGDDDDGGQRYVSFAASVGRARRRAARDRRASYACCERVFAKERERESRETHRLDSAAGTAGSFEWPRRGAKDDEAHPPIHPTKACKPGELSDAREIAVYDLVARHFVACCSRDARARRTANNSVTV